VQHPRHSLATFARWRHQCIDKLSILVCGYWLYQHLLNCISSPLRFLRAKWCEFWPHLAQNLMTWSQYHWQCILERFMMSAIIVFLQSWLQTYKLPTNTGTASAIW